MVFHLETIQNLPIPLEKAWAFFSHPDNLAQITPAEMKFRTTSIVPEAIYPGLIITYKVSPLFGLPVIWMTEITHVMENRYFIDEQRSGPYRIWHHEHHFRVIEGGVEMRDLLYYQLPFGILGDLVHSLFIRNKIRGIFEYREKKLTEVFGKMP